MKKWLLRILYAALVFAPVAAIADYTATQGAGSTVFAFVCSSTKICPATVLIDSTNVEKATAGNPLRIDPTGTTTQPMSAASLPLPTGAATSALQTTINTTLGSPMQQTGGSIAPSTLAAWGLVASTQNGATPTNAQLAMGQFNTAPTTITSGNVSPLQMDSAGNLLVNIKAGAGSGGTALTDNSAFTQGTTSETPFGCLYNTAYANATSGRSTIARCGQTGDLFANLDQIAGAAPSATNPIWTAAAEATVSAGNTLNGVTANTTGTSVPVAGYGAALVNVNCSVNCTGGTAVQFQASDVVGFQSVGAMPVAGASAMVTSVTNQSGAALFCIPNMGYTNMRANVASYSAGTITVTITPINAATCDVAQVANSLPAVSNASSGVATGSNNSPVVNYNYGFNGSTWDQEQVDSGKNLKVVLGGGSAQITASATGTTAATTATLAATSGKTTFICGFSIRANATAAATGNATVTGTITGTLNFTQWTAPNANGLGVTEELFTPCVPASATNTSIAVVSAAPGTGGVVSVSTWGYQQ